jgi:multidrug efflux pump subunit AcrA (membrane-fusion protein)
MKFAKFKNVAVIVVILAIGILGMSILSSSNKETQKRDIKPPIRTVNTEFLSFGDLNLEITGNGIVESKSILDVVSEVSGKIDFAKNNLKDGTFVKKGEIVVKVDSREIENNLFSLRSDFVNAVASILPDLKVESMNLYDKWFTYFSDINIDKNVPKLPEISNLQEKIKLSSRQIFTKYYAVKNQEILLSKYIIKAPFTGYIKSKGIIENSFVSRGQNLFTVEDVHNLEIAVPLLVDEFNQIQFGTKTKVEITSDNTSRVLDGRLIRKDPILDRNSQSLNVYVAFSNYEMIPDFLSGNYVNVKIDGRLLNNVAAVPRHLVDNDNYVYTIEEGKLAKEKLNIVEVQKEKVIVNNNFDGDLEIITTILQKPLIGMPIKSINHVAEIDSSDLKNDSVAVN